MGYCENRLRLPLTQMEPQNELMLLREMRKLVFMLSEPMTAAIRDLPRLPFLPQRVYGQLSFILHSVTSSQEQRSPGY